MISIKEFGAPWCPSCKRQKKEFIEHPVLCPIEMINVDDKSDEYLESFKLRTLPVCIMFKDDKEIKRWEGFTPSWSINNYIKWL